MGKKTRTRAILQIAATYLGTVVGAGFASGQSILQFFTIYGAWGGVSILISTFLFIWLGTKMMVVAHRIKAFSYQEFNNYLFGNLFGKIANTLTLIILFGVTAVMISGAGSIFKEQLGLSFQLGIIVSIALAYWVMTKELNGILSINSLVVPMMLFFILLIAVTVVGTDSVFGMTSWQKLQFHFLKWMATPYTYVALNLTFVQAVMVPLGCEAKDEGVLKWGGFWGGIGLGFMLLVTHFALNSRMPEIALYEIPMAEIVRGFGWFVHVLFLFVIYGEIFTTIIGNVFGMTRQIQSLYSLPRNWVVLMILLASYLISQVGFASLLYYIYPLFGYLGIALLLCLAAKRMPDK